VAGHLKGKASYGSSSSSARLQAMKAPANVAELVEAGNDTIPTPKTLPRASKRASTPVSKLSHDQLEDACDAFAMGKPLTVISAEMGVDNHELARAIKQKFGAIGKRKYQQSYILTLYQLERMMALCDKAISSQDIESLTPKWIDAKLRVIRTKAEMLGLFNKNPVEENARVAGLSSEEINEQIISRL